MCLKSAATPLFVEDIFRPTIKQNQNSITGPLWGESITHWLIPLTRNANAGSVSTSWRHYDMHMNVANENHSYIIPLVKLCETLEPHLWELNTNFPLYPWSNHVGFSLAILAGQLVSTLPMLFWLVSLYLIPDQVYQVVILITIFTLDFRGSMEFA